MVPTNLPSHTPLRNQPQGHLCSRPVAARRRSLRVRAFPEESPILRTRCARIVVATATVALMSVAATTVASARPLPDPPRRVGRGAFTLMVVPDPQKYTSSDTLAVTYRRQMEWIASSAARLDTRLVISVGDLVQKESSAAHWARADRAWGVLDEARVPYAVVPGNHDMTANGDAELYDRTFPVSRQTWQRAYGGFLGDPTDGIADPIDRRNKDSYHLLTADGVRLLVIALEVDLPEYAVDWAQDVIDAYPKRQVILVTHRWLREDGTRWTRSYYRQDTPLLTPEQAWSRLVEPNCRVFMVLMGHEHLENRRADANRCGDPVFQLLADYQDRPNGGDGWLRYYTFRPKQGRIEAFTYSPTRSGGAGEFERDADSRFTLRWRP